AAGAVLLPADGVGAGQRRRVDRGGQRGVVVVDQRGLTGRVELERQPVLDRTGLALLLGGVAVDRRVVVERDLVGQRAGDVAEAGRGRVDRGPVGEGRVRGVARGDRAAGRAARADRAVGDRALVAVGGRLRVTVRRAGLRIAGRALLQRQPERRVRARV